MKWINLSLVFLLLSLNLMAQEGKDTLLLASENVYFDFGKDEIRNTEFDRLNQLIEGVPSDVNGFIRLTGHTDSIGTYDDNYDLSERRANQVIQYLVEKRIAPKLRFYTGYNGERIPLADNGSDEGRQMNRRVEVQIFQVNAKKIVKIIAEPEPEPEPEPILEPEPEERETRLMMQITDEETNALIHAKVVYKMSALGEQKSFETERKGVGHLEFDDFEADTKMFFEFYAEGYFHESSEVLVKKGELTILEILLKPIKKGNKLALKNLYFYGNQAKLLPESIPELKRLKNSLMMNPDAIVEIGGHINYPNTHPDDVPRWSVLLSERRAEVIYNYLMNSGIDTKRLSHKGYSNTQMVNPTARQEVDMAPNRRVEVKVMDYVEE